MKEINPESGKYDSVKSIKSNHIKGWVFFFFNDLVQPETIRAKLTLIMEYTREL